MAIIYVGLFIYLLISMYFLTASSVMELQWVNGTSSEIKYTVLLIPLNMWIIFGVGMVTASIVIFFVYYKLFTKANMNEEKTTN